METKAEQKAAAKAANQALAAKIRERVAEGRYDDAYALVKDKRESWTAMVDDLVRNRDNRLAKAAEKAAKAETTAPAPAPVVDAPASVDATIAALVAAGASAETIAAVAAALSATPAPAPVADAPAPAPAPVAVRMTDPMSTADVGALRMAIGRRFAAVRKTGDAVLMHDAIAAARQCAQWCENAAQAESDAVAAKVLRDKAAAYAKAASKAAAAL